VEVVMKRAVVMLGGAIVLASAVPARAQEQEVARRSYPFFQRSLTVEVVGENAGTLRLVRGGRSRIEVVAHASPGAAAFGLGGEWARDRLRLSAVGDSDVGFQVVVPDHVNVTVWLPGREEPVMAAPGSETIRWEAAPSPSRPEGLGLGSKPAGAPYLVHSASTAPVLVELPNVRSIGHVSVRVEGDAFMVSASRPMTAIPGSASRLEIRSEGAPLDLIIQVPRNTPNFALRTGEDLALTLADGDLSVMCSPVTKQSLADGRQWADFSPHVGRFTCTR
jgi:hypothetical protein